MSIIATDNLRAYCTSALLSPPQFTMDDLAKIDVAKSRPLSTLRCLPTWGDRGLYEIHQISLDQFLEAVKQFETSLPDQPALSSPTVFGAVLKIPAPDFIVDGDYTPIGGRTSARDAVYQSVLRSTEKIVDLVYSGASQWKPVTPDDTSVDFHGEMDGWERFVWTNVGSRPDPEEPEKNLNALCVIQSPWELTPEMFAQFTAAQDYCDKPLENAMTNPAFSLDPQVRLWGRTLDYCREKKIHFFLVSNYLDFAFGVFSERYDTAYITPPIHYDTCGPTIFTMCIFWAQAARGAPDTWKVPVTCNVPRMLRMRKNRIEPRWSEFSLTLFASCSRLEDEIDHPHVRFTTPAKTVLDEALARASVEPNASEEDFQRASPAPTILEQDIKASSPTEMEIDDRSRLPSTPIRLIHRVTPWATTTPPRPRSMRKTPQTRTPRRRLQGGAVYKTAAILTDVTNTPIRKKKSVPRLTRNEDGKFVRMEEILLPPVEIKAEVEDVEMEF